MQYATNYIVENGNVFMTKVLSENPMGTFKYEYRPKCLVMPSNPIKGKTWSCNYFLLPSGKSEKHEYTVLGLDNVKTDAGDFSGCLKIREKTKIKENNYGYSYYWHCPDVGLVRMDISVGNKPAVNAMILESYEYK